MATEQHQPEPEHVSESAGDGARRFNPDPVTLTAGIMTVAASIYFLVGGGWSTQRVLAFAAAAIGVIMLVAALRRR
ncbi:hypothetical protein SAMN04487820_10162 [Actinopolyspora mzabensis]|uniref:Uncharacterized protein n=1 Tax=Actinopolyspora mzabensis TaxID=995066 RepID=A0A1G8VGH2_ACTMZ|nr:hypothetical protein [Actinopolyspora mzabensis]SDJ65004.1 hypothetical protein SAMN04487820_10162 [Actinopolyspora mzabensis]